MKLIPYALAVTASLSPTAAPAANEVDAVIAPFFDICMKGPSLISAVDLKEVRYSELPGSFQRNFSTAAEGVLLHFVHKPERYLVIYRDSRAERSSGFDQCAFAIDGISLRDGRAAVRKRLNWVGSYQFPAKVKHIVDSDPNGNFDFHYYYLQDENLMYNTKIGPRFLVLQVSFKNPQHGR